MHPHVTRLLPPQRFLLPPLMHPHLTRPPLASSPSSSAATFGSTRIGRIAIVSCIHCPCNSRRVRRYTRVICILWSHCVVLAGENCGTSRDLCLDDADPPRLSFRAAMCTVHALLSLVLGSLVIQLRWS